MTLAPSSSDVTEGAPGFSKIEVTLIFATVLPLVLRRRAPLAALGLSAAAELGLLAAHAQGPMYLGMALCVFHILARRPKRELIVAATASVLAVAAVPLQPRMNPLAADMVVGPFALYLALGFGLVLRRRSQRITDLTDELAASERRAEQAVLQAKHDERRRLATELHDVISSTVGVAGLHAGALRRRLELGSVDRAVIVDELRYVEDACAAAQRDLRRLMLVVNDANEDLLPTLDDVVAPVRAAGLDVAVELEGSLSAVTPAARLDLLAALREALANALRYGDPAQRTEVRLRVDQDGRCCLHVENVINPVPCQSIGTGRGLTLMKERIESLGGSIHLERRQSRFSVEVLVPAG